jgi:hypothetical protein
VSSCPACGAEKNTVGVVDGHLCLECRHREKIDDTAFSDRDYGIGIPGVIAEECYKLRDALHSKQDTIVFDAARVQVFSKLKYEDRISMRIDDVLSRLVEIGAADEASEQELLECLIMLRVVRRLTKANHDV